jgi:2-dehydropantoate 2-reductase
VVAAWRSAGIAVDEVADVRPAQWEKAILNATVGPLCLALAHDDGARVAGGGDADAPSGVMAAVWSDARMRAQVLAATAEGERVAAAAGIAVAPGMVGRAERFFAAVGAHRPSVLRDAGELPWILGQILATGRRHGVPMPALAAISARVAAVAGPGAVLPPVPSPALLADTAGTLAVADAAAS